MTITRLITHSGAFHGDDLFTYALLSRLHPGAELLRTRNPDILAKAGPESIVFDVGDIHDPDRGRFDHHQPDRPCRPEGLPYSAFGLVWKSFGRDYIGQVAERAAPGEIDEIHARIDSRLVRDIDAIDNGHPMPDQQGIAHPLGITHMLMRLTPDFDDDRPDAMDRQFVLAARIAESLLEAEVRKQAAGLRACGIVDQAMRDRSAPQWVELPRSMPWQDAALPDKDLLFVVNPGPDEWQLNVVPTEKGGYIARKSLPAHWAGLRWDALEKATGIEGAAFCHNARFIATARTRDAILALLDLALAD